MYTEIEGNLITLALQGKFDVIAHGCNCFCKMGAGIAPQMAQAFGCNEFPLEEKKRRVYGPDNWDGPTPYYEEDTNYCGDINKLGQIDYQTAAIDLNKGHKIGGYSLPKPKHIFKLTVVNAYTQYGYNPKTKPFNLSAFQLCMLKINHTFIGKHIGLPMIGAGLAGGDWDEIKQTIQNTLTDMDVTVVIFKP